MATTRIKDLSKTATTVNSDANLVLDGNTGGTQKISRDNFRQDTADAFVAAPGTYNLAPLNSGTGKIDAVYLSSSSDTPKGAWDASTNTPTLADGSGTAGDYYDVTVAGSSDLGSGSIAFTVGDVVKYNGTVWFKIDSVANILDGVSTIDGAKTAIEIPDVGTAPNEVPLNGMLGDMAYQSSEGISVGTLEVTDKIGVGVTPSHPLEVSGNSYLIGASSSVIGNNDATNYSIGDSSGVLQNKWYGGHEWYTLGSNQRMKLDSSGNLGVGADPGSTKLRVSGGSGQLFKIDDGANPLMVCDATGQVGIGTSSPSTNSHIEADDLVIGDGTLTYHGLSIVTNSSGQGSLMFSDGTGVNAHRGIVRYNHIADQLELWSTSAHRWSVNASGNLAPASSGLGIDFGSVAEGSGTPVTNGGLLDDYESGTLTATLTPSGSGTITVDSSTNTLRYVKVGNLVSVTGKIAVSAVSSPVGSYVYLNLPFTVGSATGNRTAGTVLLSAAASNANTYGVFVPNAGSTAYICSTDGTSLGAGTTGQDFSGDEELHINISYTTA